MKGMHVTELLKYSREHLGDDRWRVTARFGADGDHEQIRVSVECDFHRNPGESLVDTERQAVRKGLALLQSQIDQTDEIRSQRE